ncbi:LytR/AlgR family response regulator transcription factor [Fibrella arboris]|uniref:LytR/AlgR family response regulator transcription factor n=1 Tax=Fibrella arboris TaxID=3242486 RepID=UPI00351FE589
MPDSTFHLYRLEDCMFLSDTYQRYEKVPKMDVLYLRAEGSWVDVVTVHKTYRISTHLGNIATQLDGTIFRRISRSHIVNLHRIDVMHGNELVIANQTLAMGRQYRSAVLTQLPLLRTRPLQANVPDNAL